jgi:tripartite-type tricarboxylate transporter receptor subunit TctC
LFKSVTGLKIEPVQYKGTALAALAVLSGEAHMLFASVTALMPHVRAQRLVALGVTSPARSPLAQEVPTLVESGVSGAEAPSWYGLAVPAGTPKDIIGRLHGELVKIAATPDYREQLERQALDPQTATPEQFAAFLQAEYDKWGRVIKALKLQ